MPNLYVSETYCQADATGEPGHIFGESGVIETFTDNPGELYRSCQGEYGRCIGYVYMTIKQPSGVSEDRRVGWVFVKRAKYQDSGDTYLQETWVHVFTAPPTVTEKFYHAKVA